MESSVFNYEKYEIRISRIDAVRLIIYTGEGLEYSDSKDGENVLWQFKPVHEAWQKHLEVRCFLPDPFGGRKLTPQTPNHDPPSGRANSDHGHIRYGLLSS